MMAFYRICGKQPQVAPTAFVAEEATLVGDVVLGDKTSVWFGAVLRGDNEPIRIGTASNIQEGAVLHADPGFPLHIGDNVTVGHQAMLHGCTVGAGALIGIQAVILNGAVIGSESLVGAGAVITERKIFPGRTLILGAPAKAVRQLTDEEVAGLAKTVRGYAQRAVEFNEDLQQVERSYPTGQQELRHG
jgi:carbonic anhydrase/acetyltransferase-like protein (isoleucine patch superfamily)